MQNHDIAFVKRIQPLVLFAFIVLILIYGSVFGEDDKTKGPSERRRAEIKARITAQFEEDEKRAIAFATVTGASVSAPIGQLLLMRNKDGYCVVRFTEFHREKDARPPSMFRADSETLYAEYDWFYQGDGSADFSKPDVGSGHGQLVENPFIGFGSLHIQTGKTTVNCERFVADWSYPNRILVMKPNGKYESNGIELAPTKWKDVRDVNAADPKLIWYQYDGNRRLTYIPIENLPGSSKP